MFSFEPAAVESASLREVVRLQRQILASALVLVDVLLLVANVVHLVTNGPREARSLVSDQRWNGDLDGSIVEVFGHIQLIAAAVAALLIARQRRSRIYGVWAAVFVALVSDDFLQLHETFGQELVGRLRLRDLGFLSSQDLGEFLVWLVAAVSLGLLLVIGYLRSEPLARRNSQLLLGAVGALAIFAVGLDQIQGLIAARLPFSIQVASTLTETAGELLSTTGILLVMQLISLQGSPVPSAPTRWMEDEVGVSA